MAKFIIGVMVGLFLGASASAYGAVGSGTVPGWTVAKDGESICSNPNTTEACGRDADLAIFKQTAASGLRPYDRDAICAPCER